MVYASPFVIDPETLKLGALDSKRANQQLKSHYEIVLARQYIKKVILNHQLQSKKEAAGSLIALRSTLVSQVLEWTIRSALVYNPDLTRLTNHHRRFLKQHSLSTWREPKGSATKINHYRLAGHIGSLAFLSWRYQLPQDIDLIRLVWSCLSKFWEELHLPIKIPPGDRHAQLLGNLGYDKEYFLELQGILVKALNQRDPILVRHLISVTSLTKLPQRLLLGEFRDPLVEIVESFQQEANDLGDDAKYLLSKRHPKTLSRFISETQLVGYGAGMPLVYIALSIEAMLSMLFIVERLIELGVNSVEQINTSLSTTLQQASAQIEEFRQLAISSMNMLAEMDLIEGARQSVTLLEGLAQA